MNPDRFYSYLVKKGFGVLLSWTRGADKCDLGNGKEGEGTSCLLDCE